MDRDTDGAADTERAVLVGIVLLVALPVLGLAVANGPYGPTEDHALLELGVRRVVAGHPPTLGVYSRFGWYHPGPALYYLLAGPYLLLGGSSMALPVAALAVNAMCLAAVALLMRRHRGLLAALWALLVCLLYLRQLPGSFLLEVWNPYLPMLPFLVAALLCWAALQGDRWALPVALVILSACVQAHVSYAVGAVALLAVTVVLLVWLRRRRGVPGPTARGWAIGGAATLLVWLPPLWQQVAASGGGNLSALAAGLGGRAPDAPGPGAAVRLVGTELGRLPAFVFGIRPGPSVGGPAHWSVQLGLAAVAVLGLAALIATGGRDRSGLLLVVVAGTVTAAAAFSGDQGAAAVDRLLGAVGDGGRDPRLDQRRGRAAATGRAPPPGMPRFPAPPLARGRAVRAAGSADRPSRRPRRRPKRRAAAQRPQPTRTGHGDRAVAATSGGRGQRGVRRDRDAGLSRDDGRRRRRRPRVGQAGGARPPAGFG